jgi:hypothetical protein
MVVRSQPTWSEEMTDFKIEREACDSRYKALEDRANRLLEVMKEAQALIRKCDYVIAGSVLGMALNEHKEWEGKFD